MRCDECGTENEPGRKFCGECGSQLSRPCPSCGSPNTSAVKFCGECGTRFDLASAAQKAGTAREAPVAERRLVTVLFADLVGFTTLSEANDPEDVRDLLSRYFDTCRTLIERYGGTVEKFVGDAVMAVWGTPIAREDDAERAVRAALELVASVGALGDEVGATELQARGGVLTGEAAVNLGAIGQGMVAGDLVNTASRIQSLAPPGSVYVGEATKRVSEAAIEYEEAGAHRLKGKAEALQLFRAVRIVAGFQGDQRASGLEAPFVGRDRELRMIKDLFHAMADEHRAHMVSIIGPAGIGKSRIVWEFFKYMDGLVADTRWHRGRCLAYGEGVTYWALAEMVRTNADILEGESAATALTKLKEAVERVIADPEERKWVEPRLASLLGYESGPPREREDLFAAWRFFYERLAEEMPTVMVFEDVHWADASLLEFIEYLLEWSRNHALFVVTLARPDLLERRPDWASGRRSVTSIYLDPLPGNSMEQLLSGLVPGLPDELEARVLDRAEGVPLYAVETVRMLLDRGLLAQEGSVYRPTGSVDELEVPETLHGLIAARLDGLSVEERRVVQDAAVLGKTFLREGLEAVRGQHDGELDELLAALVRKEVLAVQTGRFGPERGQYAFLGDLIRWVAYETLSKRERRTRHLAAAAYLEDSFEEEDVVEVVASHYLHAFEAAPEAEDAAGIRAKARNALVRAGQRAASLAAGGEALRYFERAIELADDDLGRAELHERAGEMAWFAGHAGPARSHYERAIDLYETAGSTHPAARVSAANAEVRWSQEGGSEESLERMQRAFEVLSREAPDEALATLAAQLGRFLFFSGRTEEAIERVEFALRLAEGLQLPEVLSQALNTKSLILDTMGRPEEAVTLLDHALRVALEHDLGATALRAYNNLCASLGSRTRHEEELRTAQQGVELSRRLGIRRWEMQLLACQLNPLVWLGRWDEAVERAGEVKRAGENLGGAASLSQEFLVLQLVHVARGELDEAQELLVNAESAIGDTVDVQMQASIAVGRGRMLLVEGDAAGALTALRPGLLDILGDAAAGPLIDALPVALEGALLSGDFGAAEEILDRIDNILPGSVSPTILAQAVQFRARLAAFRGDPDAAEAGFKRAVGAFRELQLPFWMAVVLVEHGEWLTGTGRTEDAKLLLDEAREVFEQLAAEPWLERLGRLVPVITAIAADGAR